MTHPPAAAPAHTNRLAKETSPYLLQHAHNPVDWYPWGEEAIEAARTQGKPIFLSVGYSTCYWCHVMERESFEDEATAAVMNANFICIKVDREERPDIDDIYMAAVQMMTQQGGWPMSVFIDPDTLQPFYGGTYFPHEPMQGRPSFTQLLEGIAEAWTTQRPAIKQQGEMIGQRLEQQLELAVVPAAVGPDTVTDATNTLLSIFDAVDGGFGQAPKFPQPVYHELILAAAWSHEPAQRAVRFTLDRMAMGGMYDQVGGGFHRYSTDGRWLVPHFEKMIYDNGQLASVYAEAYARTNDPYYATITRETLDYVLREMTHADGAFFSAQDAEVNAREGLNYLWKPEEIRSVLDAAGMSDDVEFTLAVYGLDAGTNFTDPHHPEDGPTNILFLGERPDALATQMNMTPEAFESRLDAINAALLVQRDTREQPGLDDKVLAAWNGLMIAGMADGGRILQEPHYVDAAARAARFILDEMRTTDGGLLRSWRNGDAKIDAFMEDYAFMIRGLMALHAATRDQAWVATATELADLAEARFADRVAGGYFDTLDARTDLIVRSKSLYDGAVPSANSVMIHGLLDLYEATSDDRYLLRAAGTVRAMSRQLDGRGVNSALALAGLHRLLAIDAGAMARADSAAAIPTEPVTFEPSTESMFVDVQTPGAMTVTMMIADGLHMTANEPGAMNLIPFQVQLVGADGYALEVDYPEGDAYGEGLKIYRGTVTVPIRVRFTGVVRGKPQLRIIYQVCTDTACLAPMQYRVPVDISMKPGQDG